MSDEIVKERRELYKKLLNESKLNKKENLQPKNNCENNKKLSSINVYDVVAKWL